MQKEVLQKNDLRQFKKLHFCKITAIILLVLTITSSSLLVSIFLESSSKDSIRDESVISNTRNIDNEQSLDTSTSDELDYLLLEFNLLRNETDSAESQLFGFKFSDFHKDLECLNGDLIYSEHGITITCKQKECSLIKDLEGPDFNDIDYSQECVEELENREYPQSILPSIRIDVSPIYLEENKTLNEAEGFESNKITPKGISYLFRIIESEDKRETGWLKQYEIVFYSPKVISNLLTNYTGTFYGSEEIFAKYQIVVDVYDVDPKTKLTEEKFLNLIEKMIDSIKFLEQPNTI